MIILDKPNYPPYVCIKCGVGGVGRQWFVLLDLPIDNYFNPVNNGQIFLCNECWLSTVQEASRQIQIFLIGHEAYKGVEPTYDNDTQLVLGLYDDGTGTGVSDTSVPDVSEPITTTDTSPESTDKLSEFTKHFTTTGTD